MRGSLSAVVLGLFLAAVCYSQDPPTQDKKSEPEVIQWSIAPQVVHPNIHFILDRSGSMNVNQLNSAMSCFLYIAEQNIDEINIAITIFGQDAKRWDGCPDENTPKGWASLPSEDALKAARAWVAETPINSSSTRLDEALKTVDRAVVPRKGDDISDITVIIISDLCFDNFPAALTQQIEEIRNQRNQNQCHSIDFGFVGIYASQNVLENVRQVCERLECWLAFIERPEEPEEEEAAPNLQQQHPPPAPDPDPPPLPPLPDPNPFPH